MGMLKVPVLLDDILNGAIGDVASCPIALAIRRTVGCSASDVNVGDEEIVVGKCKYETPGYAAKFIGRFDGDAEGWEVPGGKTRATPEEEKRRMRLEPFVLTLRAPIKVG